MDFSLKLSERQPAIFSSSGPRPWWDPTRPVPVPSGLLLLFIPFCFALTAITNSGSNPETLVPKAAARDPLYERLPRDPSEWGSESVPQVCVLARTHPSKYRYLPAFLTSWTQMSINATIFLLATATDQRLDLLQRVVDTANDIAGPGSVQILPIGREDAVRVWPELDNPYTDYGYAYTDAGLDMILQQNSSSKCDYIIVSNGDNLYASRLPDYVVPHMRSQKDIIAWDFVTGHGRDQMKRNEPGLEDNGMNKCIGVKFEMSFVDLGAMAVSANFFNRTSLRFIIKDLDPRQFPGLDFFFLEKALKITSNTIRLGQVLLIHQ